MNRMAFGLLVLVAAGCRKDWERQDLDADGVTAVDGDCNNGDPAVNPSAAEVCDGRDNNCDGQIDEGVGTSWFTDADADGFGDDASAVTSCFPPPAGGVTLGGDCDDADGRVNPGAAESCEVTEDLDCDGTAPGDDADEDGFAACEDCDDDDADVNPEAVETCDEVDQDCDGVVDDDPSDAEDYFADLDGDGHGSDRIATSACEAPDGFVTSIDDCDDLSPVAYPGADELCDGADNDCNGTIDDGATGTSKYYADADKDGYGDPSVSADACAKPNGYSDNADDCDDSDPLYNPEGVESCSDPNDYNCDGSVGQSDADSDGTPACTDCDDGNAAVEPGAVEICDGVDNDCNGQTDEIAPTWYADVDGDTHGGTQMTVVACTAPTGFVTSSDDCDDLKAGVYPGAVELCNGWDDACAGSVPSDEADGDKDHWRGCEGDCDDADATANPAGVELCDGADDDCDGTADDAALDTTAAYADADADGYGQGATLWVCAVGTGQAQKSGDCDDTSSSVSPAATEACNTKDDDCDGQTDEAGATGASSFSLDADGDGVGGSKVTVTACSAPAGYVSTNTDCDDTDSKSFPAATEACDGADNNCDKASLAGEADADKDNWRACAGDCNDGNNKINPAVTEVCNTADDDCDGTTDAGAVDAVPWYTDADGDKFGTGTATFACTAPSGKVSVAGDCDDASNAVSPSQAEICNTKDDNCDTKVDNDAVGAPTWYADADNDAWGASATTKVQCTQPAGYVALGGDCNDGAAAISPAKDELCSTTNVDDDCDGSKEESDARDAGAWYLDGDNDGHGKASNFTFACTAPSGRVALADDCDDTKAAIYTGATEVWYDGIDQNCDFKSDFDQDGDGYNAVKFGGNDCDDTKTGSACLGTTQATAGRTCQAIKTAVATSTNGVYYIDPDNDGNTADAFQTYCDMTRDGGGWTLVLQNNRGAATIGDASWNQTTVGGAIIRGGTLSSTLSSFDIMVALPEWNQIGTVARIEVGTTADVPQRQATFNIFIGNAASNYTLNLSNQTITIGGVSPGIFQYHNGRAWTTYDRDNDSYGANCATLYAHPWWYGSCWDGNLWGSDTGSYQPAPFWTGSGGDYWNWGAIWLR